MLSSASPLLSSATMSLCSLVVGLVVSLLALSTRSVYAAGDFAQLAFWSDAACTVSFNPSAINGINATFTAWPILPTSSVAHTVNFTGFEPPCVANPLPSFPIVRSAQYACWNSEPINNTRGFVTGEYVQANCDAPANGFPFQAFSFIGPQGSNCVPGSILVVVQDAQGNAISGSLNQTWATFSCSSAGGGGSNNGSSSNNGSGPVRSSSSALIGLLVLLVALLLVTGL